MNLLRMNALLVANRQSLTPFSMHGWTWGARGELHGIDCNTPACLMQTAFLIRNGHLCKSDGSVWSWAGPYMEQHFDLTADEIRELFDMDGCEGARQDRAKALAYVEAFIARKLTERPAPEPDEEDEPDESDEPDEEEIAAAA